MSRIATAMSYHTHTTTTRNDMGRLLLGLLLLLAGAIVWPFSALRRLLMGYPRWFRNFVVASCVLVAALIVFGFGAALLAY